MKRIFEKPAKKNPKFWEIEVTGNSYTVTEGQTGLDRSTSTKEFANEEKCMKAAVKAVESIREKGYKETLPEYSEWPGERQDYAIWRNTEAIEFILKTLKENSKYDTAKFRDPAAVAKLAEEAPDRMSAMASELELCITADVIKIRKMAQGKDFFGVDFTTGADVFNVWYDYWAQGCSSIVFTMNDPASSGAIIDYFAAHGKGKWFGAEQQEKKVEKTAQLDEERREKYLKKLEKVVNDQFKEPFSRLALAASMAFDTHKDIYMPFDKIKNDIAAPIFECAKSKLKKNREEALCKTYYMLYDCEKQLPLVRVRQAFDELASGKELSVVELYKNPVFEKWENPESLPDLAIASADNKDDIVKAAAAIAVNADAYILQTRLLHKYIQVKNKADKNEMLDETNFFALTARYPETEDSLATFIEKLATRGKDYPTVFDYPGSASQTPIPVGATAAAALAIFGGKKYDSLIASYLDTIKDLKWYGVSCSTMRNLWKEHNATPDVPETIAIMTK